MAIVKRKFWRMLTLVAGVATFFGFTMSKPASARTIETRLADVQGQLKLLEETRDRNTPPTFSSSQSQQAAEVDSMVVSQWGNWGNWNNWSQYSPSWNNWTNGWFNNTNQ